LAKRTAHVPLNVTEVVDGKTGLDALDKTEISCPFRELNDDSSVAQPAV
jgi:hypothetical protein